MSARGPKLPAALRKQLGIPDSTPRPKSKPSRIQKSVHASERKQTFRQDTLSKSQPRQDTTKTPRRVQEKLSKDDAEIARLEQQLGLKGKKLPKSFEDDGLTDLLDGLEESASDIDDGRTSKKRGLSQDEEDWLRSKRLKATMSSNDSAFDDGFDNSDDSSIDDDEDEEDDELYSSTSEFGGFEDEVPPVSKKRENPYVAPKTTESVKYIPPSLRQEDTDSLRSLRRQIQGTLNRLSDAKVLSIAAEIEKIYQQNARQHVTSILLDVLFALICDPSPLQDTFMILHGGFVAALYRIMGAEFGAQIIQRAIEEHDRILRMDSSARGKRLTNLITFLAELYDFRVVGSLLIYDLVRGLTADLSEDNVELLLRIVRMSGSQLRHDNSAFFKDLVAALQAHQEAIGSENLSVRVKFMIEMVENLKKGKAKKGAEASAIRTEHTVRMRKTLESINKSSIKSSQPLGIGLQDVRNADKRGRWWLVGASFRDSTSEDVHQNQSMNHSEDDQTKTTDIDTNLKTHSSNPQPNDTWGTNDGIDLEKLAREQGMSTGVRRAVFITLLSAFDSADACKRLDKLGMKSKQRLEVPRIVVHCLRAENKQYNPFYLEIAKHYCRDRNLRKAFSFTLWDLLKRLEDKDEDEDDDRLAGRLDTTAMVHMGKFYGGLVAKNLQSVTLLKHVDLIRPGREIKIFTEVFLLTILQEVGKKSKERREKVKLVFAEVEKESQMIPGLQKLLRKMAGKMSAVHGSKEAKRVKSACEEADSFLSELLSKDDA